MVGPDLIMLKLDGRQ